MDIHPTAVVAPSAQIGEAVKIGPYCVVGKDVRLGDRTRLHSHVVLDGDTWLGSDCEVFPYAVLGTPPQDKKLKAGDSGGRLRIGDHNKIREHVTIQGGTAFGGGLTQVGDHNMLLIGCHIGHDAKVGSHVVFTNGAMAAGHTEIGDRAILGAMVGIHQFARIGALAIVGAGAMVSHDAPPFSMVQGDRARLVGVNAIGLNRNQYTPEQRAVIKRAFRLLFWRSGTLHQRLEAVRESALSREPACQQILDFVAASKRGVCSPRGGRQTPGSDLREGAARQSPDRQTGEENAADA